MRLIPFQLHAGGAAATYPFYKALQADAPRAVNTLGPIAGSAIARVRGDRLPAPAPRTFEVEVAGATLADAYTAARQLIREARAAQHVAWHGGVFPVDALTAAAVNPASHNTVRATLEFLPAEYPKHYGMDKAVDTNTGWTAISGTTRQTTGAPNSAHPFPRPAMNVMRLTGTIGPAFYAATTPITGPPYDSDDIDVTAVIRTRYAPASNIEGVGVVLRGSGQGIYLVVTRQWLGISEEAGGTALALASPNPNYLPGALEWWALRLRAKRASPGQYTYSGKAWSRRTHPDGEPEAWSVTTAPYATPPLLAAGGAATGLGVAGAYADIAYLAVGFSGAPAPSVRL